MLRSSAALLYCRVGTKSGSRTNDCVLEYMIDDMVRTGAYIRRTFRHGARRLDKVLVSDGQF